MDPRGQLWAPENRKVGGSTPPLATTSPQVTGLAADLDPLINSVRNYRPENIDLAHLPNIDPRLSDLSDRQLFIALAQLGFDGLVTNNYKMLDVPNEIAAIVKIKSVVVAVEALGHDPIRAVGALRSTADPTDCRLHDSLPSSRPSVAMTG